MKPASLGFSSAILGVLCDVLGYELEEKKHHWGGVDIGFQLPGDKELSTDALPRALIEGLGITDNQQSILIDMNDGSWESGQGRRRFPTIARWIRNNL